MTPIDPRGLTVIDWVDSTVEVFASLIPPMKIESDDQWQDFGVHARMLLRGSGLETPDPYQFTDWEEWAIRFNQVIANA